jgi:hypothetical protein
MKQLAFILFTLLTISTACSTEDDCRRCTGTVTNTGDSADWTVCHNDENIIRTNNLTAESEISTNTLPEAVAFFISIGLDCN